MSYKIDLLFSKFETITWATDRKILTLCLLIATLVVSYPFYYPFKSYLLGMNRVVKHQYLQIIGLKLNTHI